MILQELFDKPTNIDWDGPYSGRLVGEFNINGMVGEIVADTMSKETLEENTEYYSGNDIGNFANQLGDEGVVIEFMINEDQSITGLGGKDTYAILATVKQGVDHIISTMNPDFLFFSARELSRRKLYDRMVKGTDHYTYVAKDGRAKGYIIAL